MELKAVLEKHGLDKLPASKKAIASVELRIHEEVKTLEYSDAVAQDLVAMTRGWNLAVLQEKLAAAKDQHGRGKLSADKLAETERDAAETLSQEIWAVVRYKEKGFELDEAIRSKSGCCVSYALMFSILGRSIGLDVQGLDVPIAVGAPPIDGSGHMACLVNFADGRKAIGDASVPYVSKPFDFKGTYREKGSYWELKDVGNPSGVYALIQPLDDAGIVSDVLYCRSLKCIKCSDLERAKAMVAGAASPKSKECVSLCQSRRIIYGFWRC